MKIEKLKDVLTMALIVWIGLEKNYNFLKAYEKDGTMALIV